MLFKLKSGKYQDVNGMNYKPGDTVESESDLVTRFKNMFVRVGAHIEVEAAPTAVNTTTAPAPAPAPAAVNTAAPVIPPEEIAAANQKKADELKAAAVAKLSQKLGMDVTIMFGELAKSKPFKIHKNGELYDIADANGKKLTVDPLTKELVIMYLNNNG
jgi:hypothetical protein